MKSSVCWSSISTKYLSCSEGKVFNKSSTYSCEQTVTVSLPIFSFATKRQGQYKNLSKTTWLHWLNPLLSISGYCDDLLINNPNLLPECHQRTFDIRNNINSLLSSFLNIYLKFDLKGQLSTTFYVRRVQLQFYYLKVSITW